MWKRITLATLGLVVVGACAQCCLLKIVADGERKASEDSYRHWYQHEFLPDHFVGTVGAIAAYPGRDMIKVRVDMVAEDLVNRDYSICGIDLRGGDTTGFITTGRWIGDSIRKQSGDPRLYEKHGDSWMVSRLQVCTPDQIRRR